MIPHLNNDRKVSTKQKELVKPALDNINIDINDEVQDS